MTGAWANLIKIALDFIACGPLSYLLLPHNSLIELYGKTATMTPPTKTSDRDGKRQTRESADVLKVLVIGGASTKEEQSEILDSLISAGYAVILLGVIDHDPEFLLADSLEESPRVKALESLLRTGAPDLLIVTSDREALLRNLVRIAPPKTHILDSFTLNILKKLKQTIGQLDSTRDRLESVEMIKEVLMAGTEVSIMVVDEDLNIMEISNSLLEKAGKTMEDCQNRACHDVITNTLTCCSGLGETCLALEVLHTGRPVHTVREEKADGSQIKYFTVSAYPLKKAESSKGGVLIVWKDITPGMNSVLARQVKHIRENFSHYLQQDKMVALGKLAAAAVHEINNPIQGIMTFAKLMRNSLENGAPSRDEIDKFKSYLDLIAGESSRCGQILRNLLSFSRQGDLKKTHVDLNALCDEIDLLVGHRMTMQGISFSRHVSELLPALYGDRDQIKQALLNIVLNAVEAMPDGGPVSLSANLDPEGHQVTIRIADRGGGIPEEIKDNIFEPFFSTKAQGKGVGLGLSVVYGIIAQHGGSIDVESEEGSGSCFVMNLPVWSNSNKECSPGD